MGQKNLGLGAVLGCALLAHPVLAASPPVLAAENNFEINLDVMHTQYHENFPAPGGDDEAGWDPGFGVGASVLLPTQPGNPGALDYYASLAYNFNAGHIRYYGHTQLYQGNEPLDAADQAVFQRIEARLGAGFPILGGGESIPFIIGGYQAWNRNVDFTYGVGGGEFYHSGLFGAGWKFDQPIGSALVASLTGAFYGLAGGGNSNAYIDFGRGFGVTPEERVDLGLDDAIAGHFHMFSSAFWEHFNYSGTRPDAFGDYEPFNTTTQFGLNIGAAYSF